jgi:hypothetical protein
MKKKLIKKIIYFLIFQAFLVVFCTVAFSVTAVNVPDFILEDETVSFSPEGYTPKIKSDDEEILSLVSYFAIDKETSSPVTLPIKEVGTYQIFAKFPGNSKYSEAETSCTVTITPVTVKILTPYKTVAYSKMENPVEYTLEPEWVRTLSL